MKKLTRLLAIMTMVVIITLMSVNSVSFGYFFANNKDINTSGKTEYLDKNADHSVLKVASAAELFLAGKDREYNSDKQTSTVNNRFTILLTADINLPTDLAITADCNLDLGGFNLQLNVYTLTFEHSYHGALLVYNGDIGGELGARIRVNTPNAIVDLSAVSIFEGVSVDIVDVSADEIFNVGFNLVESRLIGGIQNVSDNASREVNRECTRHIELKHSCVYLCEDVDLPLNVYGYEVEFEYASDNTSALTADGKVSGAVGNVVDVNLTVIINFGSQQRAKIFSTHIYSAQDITAKEQVALIMAADSLEKYYYEGALNEGGEIVGIYKLYQSTYLPRYIIDIELDYATVMADGSNRDSTLNMAGNNFEIADINGYVINLDEHVETLTITTKSGRSLSLAVNGSDVSSVVDNYTIALKIAAELYGEEIHVKAESGHNGFSKLAIQDDMSKYASKGVTGVEYLMSYDIDKTYRIGVLPELQGRYLYVSSPTNPPTILQKVGLRLRFTFNSDPTIVSLIVPIKFIQDEITEGDMIAKFWPYYNYFDRLFTINSGKFGLKTFTMPFNYDDKVVYYYEVYNDGALTDIVTMTLDYYIGEEKKVATLTEVKAMTVIQISEIVAFNKAKWNITFDAYKLSLTNTELQFKYLYKFNDFKSQWYGQETQEYISIHTAPGIIKDKAVTGLKDYIIDTNLYAYVYNNSKPTNMENYSINSGKFIYTLWLNDDFAEINNTDNSIGISNYEGLQLLTNVKKLNLSGAFKPNSAINQSITNYIGGMTSLVELDLSNNGKNFSDRSIGLLNLPTGSNNGAIRRLSTLTKLEKLHLEGNFIYYFNDLRYIPNLTEVCVYNNVVKIDLLNIDTLFGTKGVVNYSVFTSMTGKGIKVNNVSEGSGYQGGADSNKVVDAISSLVYQKIIPKGADISVAYAGLSTNWNDYLSEKMTKPVKGWWGVTKDGIDELKFTFDGDAATANSFRLEYKYFYYVAKILTFDQYDIVIDFEFDIIRV